MDKGKHYFSRYMRRKIISLTGMVEVEDSVFLKEMMPEYLFKELMFLIAGF